MEDNIIRQDRSKLVVKSNDLISKVKLKLTLNERKFIAFAITKISKDYKEKEWIEISVDEFCLVCGIDKNHFYNDLKDIILSLDSKSFWGYFQDRDGLFRWFTQIWYMKNDGKIKLRFNDYLEEYLLDLKRNFTAYELINILVLTSKYSIAIYELLLSVKYKEVIYMSLDYLKDFLGCEETETYKDFRYFNNKILKKSIEEINKKTNINVEYETIRSGRRITDIKFIITTKEDYEINGLRLVGNNMLDKGLSKADYKRFVEYKQEIRNNRKEEM